MLQVQDPALQTVCSSEAEALDAIQPIYVCKTASGYKFPPIVIASKESDLVHEVRLCVCSLASSTLAILPYSFPHSIHVQQPKLLMAPVRYFNSQTPLA